jgi:hypothetical protein
MLQKTGATSKIQQAFISTLIGGQHIEIASPQLATHWQHGSYAEESKPAKTHL